MSAPVTRPKHYGRGVTYSNEGLGANDLILKAMQRKGIGLRTAARQLGASEAQISRVRRGETVPNVLFAIALCQLADVPVEKAFGAAAAQATVRRTLHLAALADGETKPKPKTKRRAK